MTTNLPTYGPTEVFHDEDFTPAVVVHVAYALSREQALTALSIGFTEIAADRNAADLTVEETRTEIEGWLAAQSLYELERYVRQGQLTAHPPEAQPVMDALGRALDRAYPPRARNRAEAARVRARRLLDQYADTDIHNHMAVTEAFAALRATLGSLLDAEDGAQ